MRFLVDSTAGVTPFSPEESSPPPRDTSGLFGNLVLERLPAEEFNARDNEWQFVMIITDGMEFAWGVPFSPSNFSYWRLSAYTKMAVLVIPNAGKSKYRYVGQSRASYGKMKTDLTASTKLSAWYAKFRRIPVARAIF